MTESEEPTKRNPRPHVGVHFRCCNVYARVYLNARGDAFVGWCPRCVAKLEMKVDPEGSANQFFGAE